MSWVVFSYTLPSKASSGPRVALWRRLRRLGAIAPAGGVQVLPARDECIEAFQWLAQEIQRVGGDALVMRVEQFEGVRDQHLVSLFQAARKEEYDALDAQAAKLEQAIEDQASAEEQGQIHDTLAKLRRHYADIARVDYFNSPQGTQVAARLARIAQALTARTSSPGQIAPATIAAYREKRWVTRPHPHVDRLACAWLIRRYINPQASIRYAHEPEQDEVAFDMTAGEFGHQGTLCTFETMLQTLGLNEPGLRAIAEIVHEIDLRDGQFLRPETAGIDAVLAGWLLANLTDDKLEQYGVALFEGLYAALSARTSNHTDR